MMQQINLYLPEFRPREDKLSAARLTSSLLAFVLLLGAYSGWQQWQLQQARLAVQSSQAEYQAAQRQTAELLSRLQVPEQDAQLLSSLSNLEESYDGKRVLLDFLNSRRQGNTQGFSEHLADLARYQVPGVRITQVQLEDGGSQVRIGGQVLRAENVTLFLQSLSQGRAFLGRDFETLRIGGERLDDNGVMDFEVVTRGAVR